MKKILKQIRLFFDYQHQRQKAIEAYLGKAQDLVDLENRQQDLARKGIY
tara:strand:+ start:234 stop:380 length:147 start_codon:yes stop_codon:yes gene_type:complete